MQCTTIIVNPRKYFAMHNNIFSVHNNISQCTTIFTQLCTTIFSQCTTVFSQCTDIFFDTPKYFSMHRYFFRSADIFADTFPHASTLKEISFRSGSTVSKHL